MDDNDKYDQAAESFWGLAFGAFAAWLLYKSHGSGVAFAGGMVVALLMKIQHDLAAARRQSRMANFYLEKIFDQLYAQTHR